MVPSVSDSAGAQDAADWHELGDTTLTRLVHEVLNANLDIRTAEARVHGWALGLFGRAHCSNSLPA